MNKQIFTFLLAAVTLSGFTQKPAFRATVDRDTVRMGNYCIVTFEARNAEMSDFTEPDWEGFEVVAGPSRASSLSIINGVKNQETSVTYYVEPQKTGRLNIPSAKARLDGKWTETEPIRIWVLENPEGLTEKPREPQRSNDWDSLFPPEQPRKPESQPTKPKRQVRTYKL